MATCILYENGEEINRIVADEDFAKKYCAAHSYTYEMERDNEPDKTDDEPTTRDLINAMLGTSDKTKGR